MSWNSGNPQDTPQRDRRFERAVSYGGSQLPSVNVSNALSVPRLRDSQVGIMQQSNEGASHQAPRVIIGLRRSVRGMPPPVAEGLTAATQQDEEEEHEEVRHVFRRVNTESD